MQSLETSRHDAAHVAAHELGHDVAVARSLLDELGAAIPTDAATPRQLTRQLRGSLERLELDIDRLLLGHGGDLDTLRREPTNLGQLVLQVVHAHRTGRQPVDIDAAQVVFNLDPVKVERILDNLLTNALQHTSEDCAVRVRAAVEPGGPPSRSRTTAPASPTPSVKRCSTAARNRRRARAWGCGSSSASLACTAATCASTSRPPDAAPASPCGCPHRDPDTPGPGALAPRADRDPLVRSRAAPLGRVG